MKNFLKAMSVILVIGIIVCVAGAAAGGRFYVSYYDNGLHTASESFRDGRQAIYEHRNFIYDVWDEDFEDWDEYWDSDWHEAHDSWDSTWDSSHYNDDWSDFDANIMDDFDDHLIKGQYHSVDLKLRNGNFVITRGEAFNISRGDYVVKLVDDTLVIQCRAPRKNYGDIVITLPDESYEAFALVAEKSDVEISTEIQANAFSAAVAASNFEFENRCTADSASFSADASELGLKYLDANMIVLNANAANMEIKVAGSKSEYSLSHLDSNLSEVTFDKSSLRNGLTSGGMRTVSVDANASNVELKTMAYD